MSSLHNRFSRQIKLPQIGVEGQMRLLNSKVLIVGIGGLGSPIALYLAAAGVGRIGIIDPDFIDITNLQRQILFTSEQVGSSKVQQASIRLKELNPELQLDCYEEYFTDQNAESIALKYDMIIDGSDNFSTKFLICEVAHKLNLPMVYGAIDQWEGQVAIFHSHLSSCYRCFHPIMPKSQIQNCATSGVLGSLVGIIGSMQATLALYWLISAGKPDHPLYPKLGLLNFFQMTPFETSNFLISKNQHCPTCSHQPSTLSLKYEPLHCADTLLEVDWSKALELIRNHDVQLIDIRENEELDSGFLKSAIHLPLAQIRDKNFKIDSYCFPKNITLLFYCQKGSRSLEAVKILNERKQQCPMFSIRGGLEAINLNKINYISFDREAINLSERIL